MNLSRRVFTLLLSGAPLAFAFNGSTVVRGKLTKDGAGRPAIQVAGGSFVIVTGDEETALVLTDKRLTDADFEVIGEKKADGSVEINPIHLAALWAHKDGKRKRVTYWCDVCAIRTYSPALCWCCREDTELDLRDPDTV